MHEYEERKPSGFSRDSNSKSNKLKQDYGRSSNSTNHRFAQLSSSNFKKPKFDAGALTNQARLRGLEVQTFNSKEELAAYLAAPTEVASVTVLGAIGIGAGLILIVAYIYGSLTISAKDEETGETIDVGTYTIQEFVNFSKFTGELADDIYNKVGDKLAQAGVTLEKLRETVKEQFLDPASELADQIREALGFVSNESENIPQGTSPFPGTNREHVVPNDTGGMSNETRNIPQGTPGTDIESGQSTREHLDTRHTGTHEDLEASVMESSNNRWSNSKDYQANAPQVSYKNEVHHLIADAAARNNEVTREGHNRGIWDIDGSNNLKRLPSDATAYQQSQIKVKHRGSHPGWNRHVNDTLRDVENDLENQYGTIQNVPDAVLIDAIKDAEDNLEKDIEDKTLGRQRGWIKPHHDGTDKLSATENDNIIG